jgi:tetratricopeptide (TPR) repeat protein
MKKIVFLLTLFIVTQSLSQESTQKSFQEIDSLLLTGRYQLALQKLESSEDSFLKFSAMAAVFYQVDKTQKAIQYYEKALALKDDYKTKIQLGKAYQKVKAHNKAIAVFEGIIENDPENLLIKYQLGKLYLTKRKANKALKTFEELQASDNDNPNYAYQKGIAYAMKKDRNAMIDSFLEAYRSDSTHVKTLYQLSNSFFKLKDKDSTRLFLEKGLALAPNHISMNRLMVNQNYREKKYPEVLEVLERLDSLTPNESFVINMFGRAYYNLGKNEMAKEYFERSKEIDMSDFKTWTYLGHVEMKLENYAKANLNYRMASFIGKEKRDEEYYGMGHASLKLEKPKEAMAMFDKAYKENRGNYKALYQLALTTDSYYKDKKKAYRLYEQYNLQFENMDAEITAHVQRRIKEIKKDYFMKGIPIED